jgi:hypothetical protein
MFASLIVDYVAAFFAIGFLIIGAGCALGWRDPS